MKFTVQHFGIENEKSIQMICHKPLLQSIKKIRSYNCHSKNTECGHEIYTLQVILEPKIDLSQVFFVCKIIEILRLLILSDPHVY